MLIGELLHGHAEHYAHHLRERARRRRRARGRAVGGAQSLLALLQRVRELPDMPDWRGAGLWPLWRGSSKRISPIQPDLTTKLVRAGDLRPLSLWQNQH